MRTKNLFLAIFVVSMFFSGCAVLSFYPLYTEDTLTLDDRIIGEWQSFQGANFMGSNKDTLVWNISFPETVWKKRKNNPFDRGEREIQNKYTYKLLVYHKANPNAIAEFHLHLVKLGENIYVDFFPEEWTKANDLLSIHLMSVHTFAKIEIGEQIDLQWIDPDWLEGLFEKNQIRINHEDNGVYKLITAQPEELQKFLIKYGDNGEIFKEGMQHELIKL